MFSSRMKSGRCPQTSLCSLYSIVDETARHMCVFQQADLVCEVSQRSFNEQLGGVSIAVAVKNISDYIVKKIRMIDLEA